MAEFWLLPKNPYNMKPSTKTLMTSSVFHFTAHHKTCLQS